MTHMREPLELHIRYMTLACCSKTGVAASLRAMLCLKVDLSCQDQMVTLS